MGGKVVDAGLYTDLQHGRVVLEFMVKQATGCRASPSRPHPRAEAVLNVEIILCCGEGWFNQARVN